MRLSTTYFNTLFDYTNRGPESDGQSGGSQREVGMAHFDSIWSALDNSPSPLDLDLGINATPSTNKAPNTITHFQPLVHAYLWSSDCDLLTSDHNFGALADNHYAISSEPIYPTLGITGGHCSSIQAVGGTHFLHENDSISLSPTPLGALNRKNPGDPVGGETIFGNEPRESALPRATPPKSHSRPVTGDSDSLLKGNDTPNWITLIKPLPQEGEYVIALRRETHVALEITLGRIPRQSPVVCSGIRIPATASVKNYADTADKNLLVLRTCLYGATTGQLYENVCANCKKREGRKKGAPSLVDFHAERDFIKPMGGKVRVEFCFGCYPKCHRESGFLFEVVLSECTDQSRIVAQYRFPVSFNVLAKLPQGQKKPPPAGGKRNRLEMERPEGTHPTMDQRSVRPRFDDPSQRDPPANNHCGSPRCGRHCNSNSSSPPLLIPPPQLHSSACPSPKSLNNMISLGQAMSPPKADKEAAPILTDVNPELGSITGGTRVWLTGMDFPTTSPLFARFGTTVVPTTFSASNLLACHLPPACTPGVVDVTISKLPYPSAPEYGTSIAKFQYIGEHDQLVPILLKIQEKGYPKFLPVVQALLSTLSGR